MSDVFQGTPNTSMGGLVRVVEDPTGEGTMYYEGKTYKFVDVAIRGELYEGVAGESITHTYYGDNVELNGQNWVFLASGVQIDGADGGFGDYRNDRSRTVYFNDNNSVHVYFYYILANKYDHIMNIQGNDETHPIAIRKGELSDFRIGLSDGGIGSVGLVEPDQPNASPIRVMTKYGVRSLELINDNQMDSVGVSVSSFPFETMPDAGYIHSSIEFYNNGNAQVVMPNDKIPESIYYDHSSGSWRRTDVPWWGYGTPSVEQAGDGIFLARISGFNNVFSSYDGIVWHNGGYLEGVNEVVGAMAYDVYSGVGLVYAGRLYYSEDDITARTKWNPVSFGENPSYYVSRLEAYRGKFVALGGNILRWCLPQSLSIWNVLDDTYEYIGMKRVHQRLFVLRYEYNNGSYDGRLVCINNTVDGITETNLAYTGGLSSPSMPSPYGIVWASDISRYLIFLDGVTYTSLDGVYWIESTNKSIVTDTTPVNAIYVPKNGVYLNAGSSGYQHIPYSNLI